MGKLYDYFSDTSFNGICHITPEKGILEKIFWTLAFTVCIFLTLILFHTSVDLYASKATVSDQNILPESMPFPWPRLCRDVRHVSGFLTKTNSAFGMTMTDLLYHHLVGIQIIQFFEDEGAGSESVGSEDHTHRKLNFIMNASETDHLTYLRSLNLPDFDFYNGLVTLDAEYLYPQNVTLRNFGQWLAYYGPDWFYRRNKAGRKELTRGISILSADYGFKSMKLRDRYRIPFLQLPLYFRTVWSRSPGDMYGAVRHQLCFNYSYATQSSNPRPTRHNSKSGASKISLPSKEELEEITININMTFGRMEMAQVNDQKKLVGDLLGISDQFISSYGGGFGYGDPLYYSGFEGGGYYGDSLYSAAGTYSDYDNYPTTNNSTTTANGDQTDIGDYYGDSGGVPDDSNFIDPSGESSTESTNSPTGANKKLYIDLLKYYDYNQEVYNWALYDGDTDVLIAPIREERITQVIALAYKTTIINLPRLPCNDSVGYSQKQCKRNCWRRIVEETVDCPDNCSPFFFSYHIFDGTQSATERPPCDPWQLLKCSNLQHAIEMIERLAYEGQADGTTCGNECIRECSYVSYTWETRSSHRSGHVSTFVISTSRAPYKHMEQKFAKSFTDVLSDFGGTLGLFTGASVLTIAHVFTFWCSVACNWCKKRRHPIQGLAGETPPKTKIRKLSKPINNIHNIIRVTPDLKT